MIRYAAGNRLQLLRNGEQYFPALTAAIDAAAEEVFLESYIFAGDQTGSLVADALARAAARGVAVRVLIDGFGAREFPQRLRDKLAEAGAQLLVYRSDFNPLRLRHVRVPLRRLHRKLACVDAKVAFAGGINVVDDFDEPGSGGQPRYDYAVRVEGPLAGEVRREQARLWARAAWSSLRRRWLAPRRPLPPAIEGGARAALVLRDSLRHRRDIENAYLELIRGAREEVLIACAYFFPSRRFRRALAMAAARGVRVALVLQGRVEYVLAHYAERALYESLLEAGIEIHEYDHGFMHAKVAVFDGRYASVGSSNIDVFSLLLAREANVFIDDAAFAEELRASLREAIRERAHPVKREDWQRLPLLARARIWMGYGVARLLMLFYGYSREH